MVKKHGQDGGEIKFEKESHVGYPNGKPVDCDILCKRITTLDSHFNCGE